MKEPQIHAPMEYNKPHLRRDEIVGLPPVLYPTPLIGDKRDVDPEVRERCEVLHETLSTVPHDPLTERDVAHFQEEIAPWIVVEDALIAKLDTLLDDCFLSPVDPYARQIAGSTPVLEDGVRITVRTAAQELRVAYQDHIECLGRECDIKRGIGTLDTTGPRVVVLNGPPGVGKTTLANAIAGEYVEKHMLSPSHLHHFDCAGLSSPTELLSLLFAQLSASHAQYSSEIIEDPLDRLSRFLEGHYDPSQSVLWIFDGLDDYLYTPHLLERCRRQFEKLLAIASRKAFTLKVIATFQEPLPREALLWMFGNSVQAITVGPLPRQIGNAIFRCAESLKGAFLPFKNHPMALRLVEAAAPHLKCGPLIPEIHAPDDHATVLTVACRVSWDSLDAKDRHILAICASMPGGILIMTVSDAQSDEHSAWAALFDDDDWERRLAFLNTLQWLTSKGNVSNATRQTSILYRLRSSLRPFVKEHTDSETNAAIMRRLIYFWDARLKCWRRLIKGRLTCRVEPIVQKADPGVELLDEERTRYEMDVHRPNWLYAFRRISEYADPEHLAALYTLYLREILLYCRITSSLQLFDALADRAIGEIARTGSGASIRYVGRDVYRRLGYASCLAMKGRTLRRMGETQAAIGNLSTAISLLRALPAVSMQVRRELAWSLTELGALQHIAGKWNEAEALLAEAVGLRKVLLKETSERLSGKAQRTAADERVISLEERYYATSLNTYGNLLNDRMDWRKGRKMQFMALKIRRKLALSDPSSFNRYVAKSLNDYGNSLFYEGRYTKALKCYNEALIFRERLVGNPYGGIGQYIARTCNNMGNTYRKLGEWNQAQRYLDRARRIYSAAAVEFPGQFKLLLARTLCNLGRVYYHQGKLTEAIQLLEEADRTHSMASRNGMAPFKWVEASNFLAIAYAENNAFAYALLTIRNAERRLEIHRHLCERNYLWQKAYTLNTKAAVLLSMRDQTQASEAIALLRQSEEERLKLLTRLSSRKVLEFHFAHTWHDLGSALRKVGCLDEAVVYLGDALRLRREIAQHNKGYASRLVARTTFELGILEEEKGDRERAIRFYQEAVSIWRELNKRFPDGFSRELETAEAGLNRLVCVEDVFE